MNPSMCHSPVDELGRQSSVVTLPHDLFFNDLVTKEYNRLHQTGHTYLDYTGGNLYAQSQLTQHHTLLSSHVIGNPHSSNPTSDFATTLVEAARSEVLKFFNADDYYCVFTQNASGALKIVGECYPFDPSSVLVLLADNHNSVNGIREYCSGKGGTFYYCPVRYQDLTIDESQLATRLADHPEARHKLLAFPAQSNVSGVQHDLGWIAYAQRRGWDVLLDAAAWVPTTQLDLTKVTPDFVSVSFYKMFGYPTGIGCLLIRKSRFKKLTKPWFAGGTVALASVQSPHHYLAARHERFEDGTVNYLDIPAVSIGLNYLNAIGMRRIHERVVGLSRWLATELPTIRHDSGVSVVNIFGPEDRRNTGGTLMMNFSNRHGRGYPPDVIEALANRRRISLRSGCFCNPGIDEINHRLTDEELRRYFSSRGHGDYRDMVRALNKMRGAVRVSVGIATTQRDLDTFISLVRSLRNKSISAAG